MEYFGTTDFDNNSRLITLSVIIISGLRCTFFFVRNYHHLYVVLFLYASINNEQGIKYEYESYFGTHLCKLTTCLCWPLFQERSVVNLGRFHCNMCLICDLLLTKVIIIIIIIIIFINCNCVITRWQRLFYMYTNMVRKRRKKSN
jgi:hypothetical protein